MCHSVTALLGIVGVWTARDKNDPEPEQVPVHHPQTVINQVNEEKVHVVKL